ncbi:uncharacterized protein LOC127291172 [Leptopilina boulardi]|uniref:uncharacterized protein LOC127291172 n=1 Tax=Leptopilina boulardi TaxID=63433 RepID=UPI0021F51BC3|nr:uncharacterized protein LOC127291172 [Leptopilina boulardi]
MPLPLRGFIINFESTTTTIDSHEFILAGVTRDGAKKENESTGLCADRLCSTNNPKDKEAKHGYAGVRDQKGAMLSLLQRGIHRSVPNSTSLDDKKISGNDEA